jgi:sensor histidine kinase YesM
MLFIWVLKKATHISLYWRCQVIGWSLVALYWGYDGFKIANPRLLQSAVHFAGDVLITILLTHLYRNLSKKLNWHELPFQELLARLIPSILILAILYTVITIGKLYLVHSTFRPEFHQSFKEYFLEIWMQVFIGGIRLMSIWLLAYYLYHYVQREIKAARENASLSVIAREAQLNNLSSQLNPHFLFNSLNNIKGLVAENPESARRAIDLLSDLLRTSLYGRDSMLISIKDELALVNDYLELEKLRFEERLQFNIEVADSLMNTLIIPFSIQTLVENAVKHGINKQPEGGLVAVKIEVKDGFLETNVQNPGTLETEKQTTGLGLKNLQERLKLQFSDKAIFRLTQQESETVLATLLIPA